MTLFPHPTPIFVSWPPQRESWGEEREDLLERLQRKRKAAGKEMRYFSFVRAEGTQGSWGEMNHTENPHTLFGFKPPLPEGSLASCTA